MNEIFEFHKQLNIKKVLIAILIAVVAIILITIMIIHLRKIGSNEPKIEDINPNSIFYSNNNSISLELSKKHKFSQYTPTQNYILELRSPENFDIFVSQKELIENKDLYTVISADKGSYIKNFTSYSNLSDITELTICDYPACTYSFHYLDSAPRISYYLQIFWIQTENSYYIIDVELPLDSLNDNSEIINEIVYNSKFLN